MLYEFTPGQRANSQLLYTIDEKQFYRFNKNISIGSVYLCAEKNCKCRVKLNEGKCFQEKNQKHDHENKESLYWELFVLNVIKSKCSDIATLMNQKKQSVRDIFYSVLSQYPQVNLNFYRFESTLQKIRKASLPKNPLSCNEISALFDDTRMMNLIGITKDQKPFYNGVDENENHAFCVFSSYSSIKLFQKNGMDTIIMDATFSIVPVGIFTQLLIIYGVYIEKVCNNNS